MKKFKSLILFLFLGISAIAQTGDIRGTVYDASTGEPIMFGSVLVKEINNGTSTDLDGTYNVKVEAGTYTLEFSYLGYKTITVTDVVVTPSNVTVIDINLPEDAQVLDEIVVTAEQTRNTEAALATLQRKSVNLLDGISSQSFKKIGDSDAAGAIKRVTGVSVEGGKYVFVRGLGDRYTKSILNGMDIPGLDPDRNALQMDIFPTSILDNILVLKTFTADLPADFTGGVVNVQTKEFPDTKTINISAGFNYNPSMHFNNQFLTYNGGKTDFLGFDDGTRDIPTGGVSNIPFRAEAIADPTVKGALYSNFLNRFDPHMAAINATNSMDYNFGVSLGDQFDKNSYKLGYNVALSYRNTTEFYQNAEYNRYGKANSADELNLDPRERQIGNFGTNDALLAAMAGMALKTKNSKIALNVLRLQNAEKKAGRFNYISTNQGANFTADQDNLEFSQRQITNVLLKGQHALGNGTWNVNWNISPTLSSITDPDIRFTRYRTDTDELSIGTEVGLPVRIWRYLDEININSTVNVEHNTRLWQRDAKFKIGGAYLFKERDYEIQDFQIRTNGIELTGNADEIFAPGNIWSPENLNGTTFDPLFIPFNPNKFNSDITNIAGYVSAEVEPISRLKAVLGLRLENYVQRYTGLNQNREIFNNLEVLNNTGIFPTANVIYALSDKQNLRMSYTQTVARPSFKEASYATIIDPLTGRTFIGGFFPDINVSTGEIIWDGRLRQTDIQNIDIRWEVFGEGGEMFSVSGFYKSFKNPIEIVQFV